MGFFGLGDSAMILGRLIGNSPTYLLLLIATLLAVRNLRDRPREGWTVLALVGLSGFMSFGLPLVVSLLHQLAGFRFTAAGGPDEALFWIVNQLPYSIGLAIHWGLVLWLVFSRPPVPAGRYLEEEPTP